MAASCKTGRRREEYFLGKFSDAPQEVRKAVREATRNRSGFGGGDVLFFIRSGVHMEEGVTVEVCESSARLVIVVGRGSSGIVLERVKIRGGKPPRLTLSGSAHSTPPRQARGRSGHPSPYDAAPEGPRFSRRVKGGIEHGTQNVSVFLEEDSTFDFVSLNTTLKPCQLFHRMYVQQRARLHSHFVTLGKASVEHTVESVVEGDGGESSVGWAFFASRNETYTLRVTNTFNASRGTGDIAVKGVVEECARVRCDGKLYVGSEGGGTNTFLSEHILMLDPTARVQAVPALEIHTNDVKASHSATVTRVTEEELFYLSSRGIPEEEARPMYIQGFLGALLEHIPHESMKGCVYEVLREKYRSAHQ